MRSKKQVNCLFSLNKKKAKLCRSLNVRFWDAEAKGDTIFRSTGIQIEGIWNHWREAETASTPSMCKCIYDAFLPMKERNPRENISKADGLLIKTKPLKTGRHEIPALLLEPCSVDAAALWD